MLSTKIPEAALLLWSATELEEAIAGSPAISVEDFRAAVADRFKAPRTVQDMFWQAVEEMTELERSKLASPTMNSSCARMQSAMSTHIYSQLRDLID